MRIDDFKKKENPVMKFLNKYLGLKYSVVFMIIKEMTSSKPTITGFISTIVIGYTIYFMIRYSNWFLWGVLLWVIAYIVQLIIRIYKSKKKKNGSTRKKNH
jgi:uncharacterized membrane protein